MVSAIEIGKRPSFFTDVIQTLRLFGSVLFPLDLRNYVPKTERPFKFFSMHGFVLIDTN